MKPALRAIVLGIAAIPLALWAIGGGAAAPVIESPRDAAELQALIDAAPEHSELVPPPGRYIGYVQIDKPLTLDGQGKVTLDAGGKGTVLLVKTDSAVIKNLRLVNTGFDHNGEDAGIQIRGSRNVVRDNVLEDVLFGIDLQQSHNNIIRRNRINSKDLDLGLRGDAIRLWYSHDNVLEDNEIRNSRDFVLWYSQRNRVTGTLATGGRYGMHFMFSKDNTIENNRFVENSVGISMMYDEGDIVRNNLISHSTGATGTCISLKEASGAIIEGNEILYCANGIFLDVSPFQPDMPNRIENNRIAFNDIAISFLNDWTGNSFHGNRLRGNITEVAVFGGGSANRNVWDGNAWDDYQGFDRDGDGIGDTPHRVMGYASRIWMDAPNTRFFKGTPLLEVVDFLDRLAPFSEPELLLEDKNPVMGKDKS